MLRRITLALILIIIVAAALPLLGGVQSRSPGGSGLAPESLLVAKLGGETTALAHTRNAFSLSARNLTNLERRTFELGDSFFNRNWVTAPASTDARDGLGPTFNAQACSSCHPRDGRGRPPENAADPTRGLLLRLSIPGTDAHGGPRPVPGYGGQLQDRAIQQVPPEGTIRITYAEITGAYGDGQPFTLRSPQYSVQDLAFGPWPDGVMLSPRVAPAVFGAGLLEAIPENAILAQAAPEDADGDGVSGRANWVWDRRQGGYRPGTLWLEG